MRAASTVAVFSLLVVSPLAGQTIRGTIVEQGSARPVSGGFVILLDGQGVQQAAALSDDQGRFRLVAPQAGEYALGVDRIGYLSVQTPLFTLSPGRTVEYRLSVRVEPIELAGIDVEVDPTCRIRPGEELATARVWEEARKALNATAWTQRQGLLRYAVRSTERRLDPWTQNVEDERTETRRGVSRGSPYVALDANRLAQGGFAHLDAETQVYYAPDATTLLSSWFLDNHCFQVVPVSEAEPGLVGLSFEPIAEGNQIDVRGTLWLDARTAELSRLDFGYTGLPRSMGRIEAGGRVEFDRLATGEWIVPRWRIRMPVVRWPTTNLYSHLTMDPSRRSPVLLAYEEDSGEVLEVVHVRSEELVSSARRFPSEPIPYVPPPVAAAAPREDPADPFPADPLENPSDPIPADPIDVVVEREEPEAELESRSRGESSYVITAEDISEMPLPLGRILERNIPGLRYMVRGSCAMLETRNGVVELVVLDGQRIHETCVLSLIQPDDVERIEFMPSIAASIEYGAVAGGGVLIVETSH